jgi:phage gpG-like protein
MPTTYHLTSHDELQDVYDALAEDIDGTDYQDWMASELVRMADLHRTFFRNQTGPDGVAWPKNAPSTIKRKGHSRILRGIPSNNHRLSRSLTERSTRTTGDAIREMAQTDTAAYMSFGSAVEYSAKHDVGGPNLPIRRHVGLTDEHVNKMVENLGDEIIKQLAK